MREAVENGFPCEGRVITGLKAGVNESAPPTPRARSAIAGRNARLRVSFSDQACP